MAEKPSQRESAAGRNASSPWAMPWTAWKDVILRTVREAGDDNIGLVASGVAFYAFLALVPLLGALVLTYGFVADPRTVVKTMGTLTHVLPADAAKLIGDQLLSVVRTSSGKKGLGMVLALAIALFGARNAAGSLIIALNIAYEEKEKRSFIRVTLLALAITAAGILAAVVGLLLFSAMAFLEALLPQTSAVVLWLTRIVTYAAMLAAASAAAATLYRYAPSREKAKWTWITPGSLFTALGWLLLTLGFGLYVANFGSYGKTYGSLASVVVLLTWIYLSSYVFLFGAELNSELEQQTARDTTTGSERPAGSRGAQAADRVAGEAAPAPTAPVPALVATETKPTVGADHPYLASRVTARGARWAGLPKVGIVGSVLSTAGLSLLRKRGRAPAGALLLGSAGLIAWWRRER